MPPFDVIILAAGKGTRFGSRHTSKVLQPLLGKPLLRHVLDAVKPLNPARVYVVVSHLEEQIKAALSVWKEAYDFPLVAVSQGEPKGTGHAVQQVALQATAALSESVMILSGDVPLIQTGSLEALQEQFAKESTDLAFLAARPDNPKGYGRVELNAQGFPQRIIEEADANDSERSITLVNAGLYLGRWRSLLQALEQVDRQKATYNYNKELYLTDAVQAILAQQGKVLYQELADAAEMQGVNTRADLASCHRLLNQWVQQRLMEQGVTILSPESTWVGSDVHIGRDSILYPGCYIEGSIHIGESSQLGPHTTILGNTQVGDGCRVLQSFLEDCSLGANNWVGPFAHIRSKVAIGDNNRIGNFVEIKSTHIGNNNFMSHLAYIGDAEIGSDINYGAGCITANYSHISREKNKTIIRDGVSLGANSVLIAPITIEEHAMIAAGSTITHNVEAFELAIARPKQTGIKGWVKRKLAQLARPLSFIADPAGKQLSNESVVRHIVSDAADKRPVPPGESG